MQERILIQFAALILLQEVRKTLAAVDRAKKYTLKEVFSRFSSYVGITCSGVYGSVTSTVTKAQRDIFEMFGIGAQS